MVLGFVRVRLVKSRAPWGGRVPSRALGTFLCALGVVRCVRSIPVPPAGRRGLSCAFGLFP